MENERYNDILARCLFLDEKLHLKHEALKAEGARNSVLNQLTGYMIDVQDIYKKVTPETSIKYDLELTEIEKELAERFEIRRDVHVVEKVVEKEVIKEKTNKGAVWAGILAGVALGGVGTYAYLKSTENDEATVEEENDLNNTQTRTLTVAEQNKLDSRDLTEEEAVNQSIDLVLGEYGTFFDAHDEKQVQARAQYIYDNYFGKFENEISDGRLSQMFGEHKDQISVEGIANVIRGMNGIPVADKEGNYYVSANMGDQILNQAAFYLLNVPSACYDQNDVKVYHNVPAHLFVPDDSEASRFLKGYDEVYEDFCEAMNRNDGQAAYNAGAKIAEKMWYEWHMVGVFGDQNPYLLSPELLKLARMGSVHKWGNYIYEFEQDARTAICVDVCVDYNSKELSQQTGDEIDTAIIFDLWDKPVAKSAGMEDEANYKMLDEEAFFQYLLNEINWQYENNYKGKNIYDNGYSLSLK